MPPGAVTALVRAYSGQPSGMLGGGTVAAGGGGAGGLAQAASRSEPSSPAWASERVRIMASSLTEVTSKWRFSIPNRASDVNSLVF